MLHDMTGALCAKPEHLELVDKAHARPGSPEGHWMRDELCARCPVAAACLDEAMTNGEHGIWGGTSGSERTRRGAPHYHRDHQYHRDAASA